MMFASLSVPVYVSMSMYIYVYIYVYIYIYIHLSMHIYMYIHNIYIYIHMRIHNVHISIYTYGTAPRAPPKDLPNSMLFRDVVGYCRPHSSCGRSLEGESALHHQNHLGIIINSRNLA